MALGCSILCSLVHAIPFCLKGNLQKLDRSEWPFDFARIAMFAYQPCQRIMPIDIHGVDSSQRSSDRHSGH